VLSAYDVLSRSARAMQLRFNIALFIISLALVVLAVWVALRFADRQVAPLAELVKAARSVGSGNFAMRVAPVKNIDEVGLLTRAFNRMTAQLEGRRRRWSTPMPSSTCAACSSRPCWNRSPPASFRSGRRHDPADEFLGAEAAARRPRRPPRAHAGGNRAADCQLVASGESSGIVQYARQGELLTLAVKARADRHGHVITFEDITRQLITQRRAAWSDVARRIAHEIKNPLTPIQLATERLKRRYRRQIVTDPELFEELTATIIRQVGDLRKMVDEFSSFARLPKPVFRSEDASDLVRQALFLQEVAHSEISFSFTSEAPSVPFQCDRHQFGQVMTNVLKNAVEAIEQQRAGPTWIIAGASPCCWKPMPPW
jgi:two-component system nitrogen regulation sensor histidine kinase NtrY